MDVESPRRLRVRPPVRRSRCDDDSLATGTLIPPNTKIVSSERVRASNARDHRVIAGAAVVTASLKKIPCSASTPASSECRPDR